MATQVHSEIIPDTPPEIVDAPLQRLAKPAPKPKKKLVRRTDRDYSQIVRRGCGGLAADRSPDEPEVLRADAPRAVAASRGHVPAHLIFGDVLLIPQGLLQLAVPGGDDFGIPVATGAQTVWAQFSSAGLAGCRAARIEVPAARLIRMGGELDGSGRNCRLHE